MINYEKIAKLLGDDTITEMDNSDDSTLQKVIVAAETAMKDAQDELDKNDKYQQLKASKSALEQGKRDVNKRQKAKIAYALELLASRGK